MHKIQEQILKISSKNDLGKLSLRDIGKLIGITDQPQKIKHHLLQLEKNGLLSINRVAKSIAKTKPGLIRNTSLVAIPILGSANCGPATIYADQNVNGYLRISGRLLSRKKDIFAIQAEGYSMNKANINGDSIDDGDYVVVDPAYRHLKNGDYVLAIIDQNATIKRYFNDKENHRIILLAESSASFSPIFIHYQEASNFLVNGKIIQVIKKPKSVWSRFKRTIYKD
jgi:repressor LexA